MKHGLHATNVAGSQEFIAGFFDENAMDPTVVESMA